MLKIAVAAEERSGGFLMPWWRGSGAAQVFAQKGEALLLERAMGERSLTDLVRTGKDDEASRIICAVIAELHATRDGPPPELVPLGQWFRELTLGAARLGGVLTFCDETARKLLMMPQDVVALHGDIHHANVLDFGPRGWLAIDPKGLRGERGFEYANLFCNPDHEMAIAPGRLGQQLDVVAETARLDRTRLLRWVLAYAGLSAVWEFNDATVRELDPSIVRAAATELARVRMSQRDYHRRQPAWVCRTDGLLTDYAGGSGARRSMPHRHSWRPRSNPEPGMLREAAM